MAKLLSGANRHKQSKPKRANREAVQVGQNALATSETRGYWDVADKLKKQKKRESPPPKDNAKQEGSEI